MISDKIKKGVERTPNKSLLYALGYTDEELERPLVGVVCSLLCCAEFSTGFSTKFSTFLPEFSTGSGFSTSVVTIGIVDTTTKINVSFNAIGIVNFCHLFYLQNYSHQKALALPSFLVFSGRAFKPRA